MDGMSAFYETVSRAVGTGSMGGLGVQQWRRTGRTGPMGELVLQQRRKSIRRDCSKRAVSGLILAILRSTTYHVQQTRELGQDEDANEIFGGTNLCQQCESHMQGLPALWLHSTLQRWRLRLVSTTVERYSLS